MRNLKGLSRFQGDKVHMDCVKSVQIRSFFWSVFSRMRTEYSVSLRTQSECRKIRTRRDSVFGHFPRRLRGLFLIHLSQFVWTVNKLIGFYEMRPLVLNGINVNENNLSDAPLLSSTEKYYILLKRITPKHNLQKQPLEVFCEKR